MRCSVMLLLCVRSLHRHNSLLQRTCSAGVFVSFMREAIFSDQGHPLQYHEILAARDPRYLWGFAYSTLLHSRASVPRFQLPQAHVHMDRRILHTEGKASVE